MFEGQQLYQNALIGDQTQNYIRKQPQMFRIRTIRNPRQHVHSAYAPVSSPSNPTSSNQNDNFKKYGLKLYTKFTVLVNQYYENNDFIFNLKNDRKLILAKISANQKLLQQKSEHIQQQIQDEISQTDLQMDQRNLRIISLKNQLKKEEENQLLDEKRKIKLKQRMQSNEEDINEKLQLYGEIISSIKSRTKNYNEEMNNKQKFLLQEIKNRFGVLQINQQKKEAQQQ